MKVGDTLSPAIRGPKPCPKCCDKVFDTYPTGFVDEFDIITSTTPNGFIVTENWSCPGCGYKEKRRHEIDTRGLRVTSKPNTSHRSKRKKRYRK